MSTARATKAGAVMGFRERSDLVSGVSPAGLADQFGGFCHAEPDDRPVLSVAVAERRGAPAIKGAQ
jgi:hypothetical protein